MSIESRRTALKVLSGSAGAVAFSIFSSAAEYIPQHFTPAQMKLLDALTETIIPTDEHSPGSRAARVAEYVDTIISGANSSAKRLWMEGLGVVEEMARRTYGNSFPECGISEQIALLETIAAREDRPVTLAERFFVALKSATVDGYYTSAIGIHQDLEYQGNTMLMDFPGCTDESRGWRIVTPRIGNSP